MNVEIPFEDWEPIGEPADGSRLLAHVVVNGLDMHFEAIEVVDDEDLGQIAVGDDSQGYLGAFLQTQYGVSSFWTTKINGRDYVIVATPFAN